MAWERHMLQNDILEFSRRRFGWLSAGALLIPASAIAQQAGGGTARLRATNPQELMQHLRTARGGETILIAPGDYGAIMIRDRDYPRAVRLEAENPARRPLFAQIQIRGSTNITLSRLSFGRNATVVNRPSGAAILVLSSDNMTVQDCDIAFELKADGMPTGSAISIRDAKNAIVSNCKIDQVISGITFMNVNGGVMSGNTILHVGGDSMRAVGSTNVSIQNNYTADFYAVPNIHPDGIQFFTSAQFGPNSNIQIRNNVIISGQPPEWASYATQGMFISSPSKQRHTNITIENNLVYTEQWHAITLSETDGGVIRNNTCLAPPDVRFRKFGARPWPWIRTGSSTNILVERNIANSIPGSNEANAIVSRDNIQVRLSSMAAPREPNPTIRYETYMSLFGTETLGWSPPVRALIPRAASGAMTAARSGPPIGYRG
jgi:hypothetical protein